MKTPILFFIMLLYSSLCFADYKIILVNGEPIITPWYEIDLEKEIVYYRKKGMKTQLTASNVIDVVYFDPLAYEEQQERIQKEEEQQRKSEKELRKRQKEFERSLRKSQRHDLDWRAARELDRMRQSKTAEERRMRYERQNMERKRKNCERSRKIAKRDMDRYTKRIENDKKKLWDIKRETYTSTSDHRKKLRYAQERLDENHRRLQDSQDRYNEPCP